MSSADYSFAPYNFVPFTEEVKQSPTAYECYESLPPHDCYVEGRLSGEISYRLTAIQEMRIGGGETVNGIKTIFRDGRGRCVIPGSTMRGFVRSHAEMLSFSYPEMMDDTYIMFRSFADKCQKLRKQYAAAMAGTVNQQTEQTGAKDDSVSNVKAGYIYCRSDASDEERMFIMPVEEFGDTGCTCFKVYENTLVKAGVLREDRRLAGRNYKPYRMSAEEKQIRFDFENRRITNIGKSDAQFEGRLLNSGYIDKKKRHYLVSSRVSQSMRPMEIDTGLVVAYNRDLTRNMIQRKSLKDDFYALPKKVSGDANLSDADYATKNGKLFFYRTEGGKVVGFGPTPYFRIPYKHTVKEGVPYQPSQGYDYSKAMFGFISNERSYKGRLSFQNAVAEGEPGLCDQILMSAGMPKASAIQMYLQQKGTNEASLSTYNDAAFTLRGSKFYWKRSKPINPSSAGNENVNSRLQFVRANSVFNGKVLFHNLSEEELGLLLLSLQYKDPSKVKRPERFLLGGGKPYGYGLVEIGDVRLSLYDIKQSFTNINAVTKSAEDNDTLIAEYKKRFKTAMEEILQRDCGIKNYDSTATVQTYKQYALMSEGDTEVYLSDYPSGYMSLSDRDKNVITYKSRKPLQSALDIMNEAHKNVTAENSSDGVNVLWRGNRAPDKRAEQAIKAMFGRECQTTSMTMPISPLNVSRYKGWIIVSEERTLRREEEQTAKANGLKIYVMDPRGKITEKK